MYFVVRGWQILKCRLTFARQRAKVVKGVPSARARHGRQIIVVITARIESAAGTCFTGESTGNQKRLGSIREVSIHFEGTLP